MRYFALPLVIAGCAMATEPKTVHFGSADHKTKLVGYLFEPEGPGPHAAIVLLHGRSGAYSSLAHGVYTAATLSKRHKEWGEFWRPGYHVCLDCCKAGVAGFPDRLRKHAEALEERAAELRKLINAKWQEIELDDEALRENDPLAYMIRDNTVQNQAAKQGMRLNAKNQ